MRNFTASVLAFFLLTGAGGRGPTPTEYNIDYNPAVCSQADYDRLPEDIKPRSRFVGVDTGFVDAIAFDKVSVRLSGETVKISYRTQTRRCLSNDEGQAWEGSIVRPDESGAVVAALMTEGHLAPMGYFFGSYNLGGLTRFALPLREVLDTKTYDRYQRGELVGFSVNIYHGVTRDHEGFRQRDLRQIATRNPQDIGWIYGGYRQYRLTAQK